MPTRRREPRGKYAADSRGQVRAHGRQDEENMMRALSTVLFGAVTASASAASDGVD